MIYTDHIAIAIQVIERKQDRNVPHSFEFSCQHYNGSGKQIFVETLPFRNQKSDSEMYLGRVGGKRAEKFIISEAFYKAKGINNLGDIFFAVNSWVSNYIHGTNYVRLDEIIITAQLYESSTNEKETVQVTAKRGDQQFLLYPMLSSNKANAEVYLEKNKDTRSDLELQVTQDFFRNRNFIGINDVDRAIQAIKEWMHLYMTKKHGPKTDFLKVCTI